MTLSCIGGGYTTETRRTIQAAIRARTVATNETIKDATSMTTGKELLVNPRGISPTTVSRRLSLTGDEDSSYALVSPAQPPRSAS